MSRTIKINVPRIQLPPNKRHASKTDYDRKKSKAELRKMFR